MLVKFLVGTPEDLTKSVVTDPLISTFLTPETIMLPVKLTAPWTVGGIMLAEKAEALVFRVGVRVGANYCIPIIVETVEDKPFMLAVHIVPYSSVPALQLTYSWPSGERGNFAIAAIYDQNIYNPCSSGAHSHSIPGGGYTSVSGGGGVAQQSTQNLPNAGAQQALSNAMAQSVAQSVAQSLYGNSGGAKSLQAVANPLTGNSASAGNSQAASGLQSLGNLCATNPFLKKLLTRTKKGTP